MSSSSWKMKNTVGPSSVKKKLKNKENIMEKVSIEYYSVKMLYDEDHLNKFQNFNSFWEACGTYHNWCDSHTFMVVMTRTVISNSTMDEYPMAVYDPEKDKEDREKVFF